MRTSWHPGTATGLSAHELWIGRDSRVAAGHDVPVALDLGEGTVAPALRQHRPAWRDPRLWVGIVLVCASVVVGARVLASADDTVQIWAVAGAMGAGEHLDGDDLVARRVRFADGAVLRGYFEVTDTLPADLELTRSVDEGELLPRGAVGTPQQTGLVELPVAVDPELVPPGVGPGDRVDVYVVAPPTADPPGPASAASAPVLRDASVVDAPEPGSTFGTSGKRQVVLAVPESDVAAYFALLARYDAPTLTVVRRG